MGVLSCNRVGCENIMCDTHVDEVGYICQECQEEFEESFSDKALTEREIIARLKDFMDTEKQPGSNRITKIKYFFEQYN